MAEQPLKILDYDKLEIGEELGSYKYVLTQEMLDNFRASIDDPEPWKPVEGSFQLPTRPGLGMELNLDAIKNNPPIHWNRGFHSYLDGTPAFL